MRISDWSSDVCSSDLLMPNVMLQGLFGFSVEERDIFVKMNQSLRLTARLSPEDPFPPEYVKAFDDAETAIMRKIGRASCRERVCQRVKLGGTRIFKKKKSKTTQDRQVQH